MEQIEEPKVNTEPKTGMIQLTPWREDGVYDKANPFYVRADAIVAIVPLEKTLNYSERTRVDYETETADTLRRNRFKTQLVIETSAAINIKRLKAGGR